MVCCVSLVRNYAFGSGHRFVSHGRLAVRCQGTLEFVSSPIDVLEPKLTPARRDTVKYCRS